MNRFFTHLLQRVRPDEGWTFVLLAASAMACAAATTSASRLNLPVLLIGLAGVGGVLAGRSGAKQHPATLRRRVGQTSAYLVRWAAGVAALLVLLSRGIPPLILLRRDLALLWAAAHAPDERWSQFWQAITQIDSPAFVQTALVRLSDDLQSAPNAGYAGARLIASLVCVLVAWSSGLVLGAGVRYDRRLLVWTLPAFGALTTIVILSGAGGFWMVFGTLLLFVLVLLGTARQRQQQWHAAAIDTAPDLRDDAVLNGSGMVLLAIPLALVLAFAVDTSLARLLWQDVDPPSGLAELDRSIQAGQRRVGADGTRAIVALSSLPTVALGQSLETAAPETLALTMQVSTPPPTNQWPHYLRGRVLNSYVGNGWRSTAIVRPQTAAPISVPVANTIVQDIIDQRADRGLLLGLPNIISVDTDANGERLSDGSLTALVPLGAPNSYRVLSRPPELTTPPVANITGPDTVDLSAYVNLPRSLPQRVRDLARAIARDSDTPYEQALALETYLRALPYSYQVTPLSDDSDGVDQFLFSMRQGYCTYYASAMAIMARTLGIPARVAIGYTLGDYDPATRTYTVREADAHAWPELYLNGDWLPFEPTPIRPLPARNADQASAPVTTPVAVPQSPPITRDQLLLLAGVLLALIVAIVLGRRFWPLLAQRLPRRLTPQSIQRQLEQRGQQAGVAWPAGATLQEYTALLGERLPAISPTLQRIAAHLSHAQYGTTALSVAEWHELRDDWRAVARQFSTERDQA